MILELLPGRQRGLRGAPAAPRSVVHTWRGIALNGIAQGYITDRVADLLRKEGLDDVLVDLGEIRGLGRHADGRPWTVGLKDPLEPARIVDTLTLENRALASSAGSPTRFHARG